MDITPVFIKIILGGINAYFLALIAIVLGLIFVIFKRSILKPDWRRIILCFVFAALFITLSKIVISPHPTIFEESPVSFLEFFKTLIEYSYYEIFIIAVILVLLVAYIFSCLIVWIYDYLRKK